MSIERNLHKQWEELTPAQRAIEAAARKYRLFGAPPAPVRLVATVVVASPPPPPPPPPEPPEMTQQEPPPPPKRDTINVSTLPLGTCSELIIQTVSTYYNIPIAELMGHARHGRVCWPRHVAMYLIKTTTLLSTGKVGLIMGHKDHTTVVHACKRITEALQTDPTLAQDIENIKAVIASHLQRTDG
jgi:hypothetical protein